MHKCYEIFIHLWCISLYRLLITEGHSQVYTCTDTATVDRLVPLIYLPVKESSDYYSLGDILANGQSLDGTMINILAAVKSVGISNKVFTGFKLISFIVESPNLVAYFQIVFYAAVTGF